MAGLPFGIFFEAMPTYMRVVHCSLAQIGLMAMAQLPWSLKILWSPFLDRYGRLDRWLRAAQLGLGLVFVLLIARHPTDGGLWMLPLMVALASASAVQDTVCDAAFVHMTRMLPPKDAARAAGWRISAYKLAMMASGGGAIALGALWGWRTAFTVAAALCLASALMLPQTLRPMAAQPPVTLKAWGRALVQWLGHRGAWGTFAFILFYKLGLATLSPMTKPYWVDAGVNQTFLGMLSATVGLLSTVGGALLAGRINSHRGMILPLVAGTLAEFAACLVYALAVYLPYSPALLAVCLMGEGLAQGMATAALMQLLGHICDRSQAATQFAALTATFGITRALGGLLGGFLAEGYGYRALFSLLPFCCLWSLLWLRSVQRRLSVVLPTDATAG
jgi:PAT family beta-lactamase induction signal transducer AmpG